MSRQGHTYELISRSIETRLLSVILRNLFANIWAFVPLAGICILRHGEEVRAIKRADSVYPFRKGVLVDHWRRRRIRRIRVGFQVPLIPSRFIRGIGVALDYLI